MSAPCSLEHCHTNLFALQSLNDMKWKCFRRASNYRPESNHLGRPDNYKDPVLIAFWNALRTDTLCAWRRVPTDDGQKTEKELWLFAFNDELPNDLPNLRPMNQSNGSWSENALSYECRSMLFKALHNMIERYLLSKGFARLNKWFVLPLNDHSDVKIPNYSFHFNFFLHGDNKVCASVDVQRHRYISNITTKDLERTSPLNVILAPYGINGTLIGPVHRDIDVNLLRENWEKNYPIRRLEGLPDFVEVTASHIRMFYPTCYVYKIVSTDDATGTNESSTTKKSDVSSSVKKSKNPTNVSTTTTTAATTPPLTTTTTTTNTNPSNSTPAATLDSINNPNKIDSTLVKNLSNQLLISAQRSNCVDIEKKQENKVSNTCQAINDPMSRRTCRCHHCLPSLSRLSNFIPFHRRPRSTPVNHSDPSVVRPKSDLMKSEENLEHVGTHIESSVNGTNNASTPAPTTATTTTTTTTGPSATSSSASASPMVVQNSNLSTTNEKTNEWTASTPNSVMSASGPPSVLAPITNLNSIPSHSPAPANMAGSSININSTTTPTTLATATSSSSTTNATTSATLTTMNNRGLKRSATAAFDDLTIVEDDERDQHKQTYDFHITDRFLQLPLKRFRPDNDTISTHLQPSLTNSDHLYRHGQPTPPSPSHLLSRIVTSDDPYEFYEDETSSPYPGANHSRTTNPDGPSMSDLDTIIDSHEPNENKSQHSNTVLTHLLTNGNGIKSPMKKDPATVLSTITISNGNTYPVNKCLNGVLHETEQIYNTPPGSSSSDKLQGLHSPYAIMVDSVSSAASTFDMLNQFSQESIIAPFESISVEDHSSYHPLKKSQSIQSIKRYEPTKSSFTMSLSFSSSSSHSHPSQASKTNRQWKRTMTNQDYSCSPFNSNLNPPSHLAMPPSLGHSQQPQQQQQQQQQYFRQQHTPRSAADPRNTSISMSNVPTPNIYSPMNNNPSIRSTDLQSSPFPIRSVGSVQAINSPSTVVPPTSTSGPGNPSYGHPTSSLLQGEVDSLLFNVLLNDSILNLFRDMNFDSCVLCACTPNELSIRGVDSTIYLEKAPARDSIRSSTSTTNNPNNQTAPSPYHPAHLYPHQQSPYHLHSHSSMYNQQNSSSGPPAALNHSHLNNSCSCGFSAVVNLRLSLLSGLFYEDEVEITGMKTEMKYRTSNEVLPVQLLELIERKECLPSPFDYFLQQTAKTKKNGEQDRTLAITTSTTLSTTTTTTTLAARQPVFQYENWACRLAIEQSRNHLNTMLNDDPEKNPWLHQWSYSTFPLDSDQQMITMLRALQPLLSEALKKRNVSGLWNNIDGPLTWKSFHQLLCVQSQHVQLDEQISGPQPIPYLLAGLDREWVMLAPYGLKFWDKLCLEPYSKGKDVAYVCVVPDNDYIASMTKTYFREFSSQYELCRLGLHRPLLKAFTDQGLLRVVQPTGENANSLPNVNQWFTDNETTHRLGSRLKLYAQTLKAQLSNLLSTQTFDTTLLEEGTSRRDLFRTPNDLPNSSSSLDLHSSSNELNNNNYALSPISSSTTTTSSGMSNMNSLLSNNIYTTGSTANDTLGLSGNSLSSMANGTMVNGHQVDPVDLQAFESFYQGRIANDEQFFIVIYLIDTFRYELTCSMSDENNSNEHDQIELDDRLDAYIKKAIFRAYMDLIKDLPEKISLRVNVQIIPFESIVSHQFESDSELRLTQLKRLAFHVYGQLKRTVSYTTRAKSLTGFGPAASEEKVPAKIVMQLYTPAYILSPISDFRFKPFADITEQTNINGSILFCSYCLSDDQRYLLASCSDDRGELLETCSINIEVPDRHKRKVQHARRIGLQKLWDFIMRVITSTTMPWRIVVGRLGRLGHGELKSWGIILSKKNLVRCANFIRESCPMCHILRCHDQPVILSACLISLETHPSLTILPESIEMSEIRGAQAPNPSATNMQNTGQVLDDVSVTHILTLPTSASVQHVQPMQRQNDHRSTADNDDDLFSKLFEDLDPEGPPNEAFDNITSPTPGDLEYNANYGLNMNHHGNSNGLSSGQHHRLGHLSSNPNDYNGNHPYGSSSSHPNQKSNSYQHFEYEIDMNENPSLHQQPLALGFYVSTIGTLNPLPLWMLHGKSLVRSTNTCSVFKATLHVNVPNAQHSDDMLFTQNNDQKLTHPLDSNYTYVVLRHVLESYNRLSWLLIDAKSNERASCLPIHLETLLRLYHAFVKFV